MGHHNRHFSGDPNVARAVWGPPTSTANFCEEDYAFTLYIAEFVNTWTNIAYVYYAVQHPGPSGKWYRPDFSAIALWVLGISSGIFHATLKHSTQYGDELAMLVLAGALLQGALPRARSVALVIWASVIAASALYLKTGEILHQVWCFQGMILIVGIRTVYIIRQRQLEERRQEQRGEPTGKAGRLSSSDALRNWITSLVTLAFAYALWHVDLEACSSLRRLRILLGLPFAWILELHGWWHVLTALGASMYIELLRDLMAAEPNEPAAKPQLSGDKKSQ